MGTCGRMWSTSSAAPRPCAARHSSDKSRGAYRKGHQRFSVTSLALKARKASRPESTVEEGAELLLQEGRNSGGIGADGGGEEGFEVLAHDLVKDGSCRVAGRVPEGCAGGSPLAARNGLPMCAHETGTWQPCTTAASLRVRRVPAWLAFVPPVNPSSRRTNRSEYV